MELQIPNSEGLTFEKVWLSIQESRKEFQDYQKQAAREMKELRQELGGIGKSQGEVAEHYFFTALRKEMKLLNVELNEIEANIQKYVKSLDIREQYDIILTNTDIVVVVEVKYKVRKKDVLELYNRKIPNYRKLFPHKSEYKIYGAIAGFAFENGVLELAEEYGFIVLSRIGKNIAVSSDNLQVY